MTLELTTTRGANDALTTTTPMRPRGRSTGLDAMLEDVLRRRLAGPQAAPNLAKSAAAKPQPAPVRSDQGTWGGGGGAVGGGGAAAQASERPLERIVHDPRQSPYAKMTSGLEPTAVTEKGYRNPKTGQIEWEFDSIRPSGGSGGIQGGGMSSPSSLHSSFSEGGEGPPSGLGVSGQKGEYLDTNTGQMKPRK